jgi:hypothetical protein
MAAAIIVMAITLIVGSMLWVLPSPKERRQMRLRQLAMDKGLRVQLTRIKDMGSPGKMLDCVAYRLSEGAHKSDRQNWKLFRTTEEWRMDINGWSFGKTLKKENFPDIEAIKDCVTQLPEDCVVVESTKYAVSIYWNEQGDENTLVDIEEVLKKLLAL